ncbi:MAG: helix-turn-helix transcriptional regulator [Oscillospiraceae bacterium]|nr:helix-turn-helix transcriptional regulator [Oscillospiraceae bacterium]
MIAHKDIQTFEETHRILLQASEFICVLPHAHLRAYISNYNITFPTKSLMPDSFTELPCGCATISAEKRGSYNHVLVDLHGPTTKPYIVGSEANQIEMMVSIEFKPAGFYALTGISQSELTDRTLPLEAVDAVFAKLISETVEQSSGIYELVTNLDTLLLTNVRAAYRPELMLALQDIKKCAGNISVKQLSHNTHYSERQLNRIFNQFVGTSTKSFSRLIRVNNTFRLLKKTHKSLAYISDMAGFHDLSHFIHDFKLVCGVTPQEYRNNMSDFYNNPTRF